MKIYLIIMVLSIAGTSFGETSKAYGPRLAPLVSEANNEVLEKAKKDLAVLQGKVEEIRGKALELNAKEYRSESLTEAEQQFLTAAPLYIKTLNTALQSQQNNIKELEAKAESQNDPAKVLDLQKKLENLQLMQDYSKIDLGLQREESKLQAIEAKLDATVLAAYMRRKMEKMLASSQFCSRVLECSSKPNEARPRSLRGLFEPHGVETDPKKMTTEELDKRIETDPGVPSNWDFIKKMKNERDSRNKAD